MRLIMIQKDSEPPVAVCIRMILTRASTRGLLGRAQDGFKALDKAGLFVPVWPVDHQRLGFWMRDRASHHGLNMDMDAARLLGERTEGNLLAADQELQKLALLLPRGARLDVAAITQGVEDSARYDVFTLSDACLRGERERASRILKSLQREGLEAPIVAHFTINYLNLTLMQSEREM